MLAQNSKSPTARDFEPEQFRILSIHIVVVYPSTPVADNSTQQKLSLILRAESVTLSTY